MNQSIFPVAIGALLLVGGCAKKNTIPPAQSSMTTTTSASPPASTPIVTDSNLNVSSELLRACSVHFDDVNTAPKFDFDKSALQTGDQSVLDQIAKCVTTGPLAGRSLELVGRADPRGEVEYNFVLGEHRADSAKNYLESLGVTPAKISDTSRGKLDATGTDEAGWQRDRRVDVLLKQ